ncbi:prepilin peptidase [Candidatus Woesearchaeota archaeon]|nr:prepilin peptidase [Candidatus Woesearchaeota archaeon]
MFLITTIAALAALLAASWSDIRTREVPDWLNYSLIAVGLANGFIASILFKTWTFAAFSLAGLLIFVGLAYLMFYAGQWGGGDSKLIMGLGALFGFEFSLQYPFVDSSGFLIAFWLNTLLAGVTYAVIWSIVLALRNTDKVKAKFFEEMRKLRMSRNTVIVITIALVLLSLFTDDKGIRMALFMLAVLGFVSFYLLVLVRSVERSCMFKLRAPSQLTEGDWIAKEVRVSGNYICGPKDLGISKKQIARLVMLARRGKVSKILIKEGIPFVPSFLAGFLMTLGFGNIVFSFL